jgi:hypothetical protein
MAQYNFAGNALPAALASALVALAACANSEQPESYGPAIISPTEPDAGVPEFHGADIGEDALRSRLDTE